MDDDKILAARCQLGTALSLFLADEDPISVHCLACGGGELAEYLAEARGEQPFHQHALDTHADLAPGELKKLKNQYWNAFKHATMRGGGPRSDVELLSRFDDEKNDHVLFVGWYDYAAGVGALPVEAQVFQAWYYANFPEKLALEADFQKFATLFPGIRTIGRARSKKMMRQKIKWAKRHQEVMNDPRTDRRKLIIERRYLTLGK